MSRLDDVIAARAARSVTGSLYEAPARKVVKSEKPVSLRELQRLRDRLCPRAEVNAAYWLLSALIADVLLEMPGSAVRDAERALEKLHLKVEG